MNHISLNIEEYFKTEASRGRPYSGQMTPHFQAGLAALHRDVTAMDCYFYHSIELPDGRVIKGDWDLRGAASQYLGELAFNGKAVIEYGPASGYLSDIIAKQGAELTVFDLPLGSGPEIMPFPGHDTEAVARNGAVSVTRQRNSWWFTKNHLSFEAKAVYADIYRQPDDIGIYDIAIFGAILLHLSNPFLAIREAARITRKTIVITDVNRLAPYESIPGMMQIADFPPPIGYVHWWNSSVSALQIMLRRLGFTNQSVAFHTPLQMAEKPPMVTIVAHRG
jgi:O-methyltransferase